MSKLATLAIALVAVNLLLPVSRAEESKVVIGPRNLDLSEGAQELLAGNAAEGVKLTLRGLAVAQGKREKEAALSNLCAGYIMIGMLEPALEYCNMLILSNERPYSFLAHDVLSISPTASVLDAIKLMGEKGIGALIVLDGDALAGIVTERDYARKVILKGRGSHETPVKDIMSADVLTTSADQTVDSCMNMMTDRRIRHLPVVDGDKVTGMVSIGDLVKAIIADQKEAIEQLEHYITG